MMKTYKKYLVIFTIIISVFICTACSEDKKDSSSDLSNLVDEMTAVNYAKYVDQSKAAQDKMTYDNIRSCLAVAVASPDSNKFCVDNAPITVTVNNDGVTFVDKNGKNIASDSPFMQVIYDTFRSDAATSTKCKIEGAEYKLTIKPDLTLEETLAPEE
jgi:outer membrane lipoprotein-sorting protein